ncbi:MAG: Mov34/MPN/PAD-1 family protein [Clostridia bacterium]|nr:Mov34/MPN/PAD-1 family protein [Clostridia bacterium]
MKKNFFSKIRQYTETVFLEGDDFCTPSYTYSDKPSKKCDEAIMSTRAMASIVAEAYANGENESGGVMLGTIKDGKAYIVEATDPGYGAEHSPTIHEMNKRYVNYVYRVLSRLYKKELRLVGFWHRHPGRFNRFSSLDDNANLEYAKVVGGGTLSFILNFTPSPKLTCYYFDCSDGEYHPVKLTVSDKILAKDGYLKYAAERDFCARAEDMQNEMKGYA